MKRQKNLNTNVEKIYFINSIVTSDKMNKSKVIPLPNPGKVKL